MWSILRTRHALDQVRRAGGNRGTTFGGKQHAFPSRFVSGLGGSSHDDGKVYLHVGPAGDCWTGNNIFAAKHLQPDYVKSILLPTDLTTEVLLEQLEQNSLLGQQAYDTEQLPEELLKRVKEAMAAAG